MSFLSFFRRSQQEIQCKDPEISAEPITDHAVVTSASCLIRHDYDDPKPELYSIATQVSLREGESYATIRQTRRCMRCGKINVRYRSYVLKLGAWKESPFSR
jgi:hypothetical protein